MNLLPGLLGLLCLMTVSVKATHRGDHQAIFLKNELVQTKLHAQFHEQPHPSKHFQGQSLEERLADSTKHSFLVHFNSKDAMHAMANTLLDQDPEIFVKSYVPEGTYVCYMTHAKAEELGKQNEFIDWIGYLKPEHKIQIRKERHRSEKLRLIVDLTEKKKDMEDLQAMVTAWSENSGFPQDKVFLSTPESLERIAFSADSRKDLEMLALHLAHDPQVHSVNLDHQYRIRNQFSRAVIQQGIDVLPQTRTWDVSSPFYQNGLKGDGQIVGTADTGLDYRNSLFADNIATRPNAPPFRNWIRDPFISDMISDADLQRRKIVQYVTYQDGTDYDGHGTHVAGSIAGYPVNDSVLFLKSFSGQAPNAKIAFFDIDASTDGSLYIPDSLVTGLFNWAYGAGARIHTNSWGTDRFLYSYQSQDIDTFSFMKKDFIVLIAGGNAGSCADDKLGTIGEPATAKNCIAVGASLNAASSWSMSYANTSFYRQWRSKATFNMNSMAFFSSEGPTEDGRLKPDVSVPGYWVYSANNGQVNGSRYTVNSLIAEAGTSMASPSLAGIVAILRQYITEGYYPTGKKNSSNAFLPSGSLLKALVINGAIELTGHKISVYNRTWEPDIVCSVQGPLPLEKRPSFQQGYGRFKMNEVLYLDQNKTAESFLFIPSIDTSVKTSDFNDRSLAANENHTFAFCLFPGTREARINLVWTDPPSDLNSQFNLINDLDLKVSFQGQIILGNTQSDVLNQSAAWLLYYYNVTIEQTRDQINNVEAVYLDSKSISTKTDVKITVSAITIGFGASQTYSLVVSGNFAQGSCDQASNPGTAPRLVGELYVPASAQTPKPTLASLVQNPTETKALTNVELAGIVTGSVVFGVLLAVIFIVVKQRGTFFAFRRGVSPQSGTKGVSGTQL